jgi:hypothetical protein
MTIEMISFNPKIITSEGKYWCIVNKRIKRFIDDSTYLEQRAIVVTLTKSNNKMIPFLSGYENIHLISKQCVTN